MSDRWPSFLQRWISTTLGVLLAAGIVNGIRADTIVSLLAASLLLGVLNAFLRPVLMLFALPLLLITLGLFTFVINALLLYFVGSVVKGFYVASFWAAFKGSLLISIVSFFANLAMGHRQLSASSRPTTRPVTKPPNDTGDGPVIDV